MGCAEIEDGRTGVLGRVLFTLPKGLVVREASATAADWFEPQLFYSCGQQAGQSPGAAELRR